MTAHKSHFQRIVVAVLCLLFVMALAPNAFAVIVTTDRTESTMLANIKAIQAGKPFWVAVQVKLRPGWHTYWVNPGDSGTPPSFTWTLPSGFTAGAVQYLAPDIEKVGPLVDYAYSNTAYFLFPVMPAGIVGDNATAILMLKARWLVCKDVCIPETADLSLPLPVTTSPQVEASEDAPLVNGLVGRIPAKLPEWLTFYGENDQVHFDMNLPAGSNVKSALLFPAEDGFITNAQEQNPLIASDHVAFSLKKGEGKLPASTWGLISLFDAGGERKDYQVKLQAGAAPVISMHAVPAVPSGLGDIATAALFALLGGLVLNLMPCVFPILSLKALAIAKKSDANRAQVRLQGLAYTLGAMLSFIALAGILIALQHLLGRTLGWGYQMQSPMFVAALAILFFIVGMNLSGAFELPGFFGSLGNDAAGKDNALGSFLTGALAVLVATPCTAPFMAPAIGFALTQDALSVVTVFASLGLGLAAPFLLLSLLPSLTALLPKPGAWMLTFKQFLSFPMYLTVVWLLWVLTREAGADASAAVLFGLVLLVFSLWLHRLGSVFFRAAGLLVMLLAAIITVIIIQESAPADVIAKDKAQPFSMARLEALRAGHNAVFVDATADWCITCKVNERVALSDTQVKKALEEKRVTYLIADWTKGDAEITQYLASFGRRGVPIYVYYPASGGDPVVLPQILTPSDVLKVIGP